MNIPQKNWLEWTVFAIGLVLVASVFGFLVYDAVTLGDAPPMMAIEIGQPEQQGQHIIVPVAVTNQGDQPAEGVVVEVIYEGEQEQQQAQFEIAFLPRSATGEGWASFQTSSGAIGQFKARIIGYQKP
ncbi:MAG: hypothetical protein M3R61_11165 [Chloroflexota bacterium]|nr:hypothetical protein [Chloroflexota bacterium]